MQLVYKSSRKPVEIGQIVQVEGVTHTIMGFTAERITVRPVAGWRKSREVDPDTLGAVKAESSKSTPFGGFVVGRVYPSRDGSFTARYMGQRPRSELVDFEIVTGECEFGNTLGTYPNGGQFLDGRPHDYDMLPTPVASITATATATATGVVLEALRHVVSLYPEVTQVRYMQRRYRVYETADGQAPIFEPQLVSMELLDRADDEVVAQGWAYPVTFTLSETATSPSPELLQAFHDAATGVISSAPLVAEGFNPGTPPTPIREGFNPGTPPSPGVYAVAITHAGYTRSDGTIAPPVELTYYSYWNGEQWNCTAGNPRDAQPYAANPECSWDCYQPGVFRGWRGVSDAA